MVTRASPDTLLRTVLRSVARSFYLTLAVVPSDVRAQVGVAYLLARAADTIADTDLIEHPLRLQYLTRFREWVMDPTRREDVLREVQAALLVLLDQADVRPSGGPASVGRGGDGERRHPLRQGVATDERPAGPCLGPAARPLLHPDSRAGAGGPETG